MGETLALGIGSHLGAVSAQIHAAPMTRSFLTGIEEMQDTSTALPDTCAIRLGEEFSRCLRKRRE